MMGTKSYIVRLFLVLGFFILLFTDCNRNGNKQAENKVVHKDIEQILEEGKITAVTDYNSTNYFLYRGEPMGFQFDLLKNFADHLGVRLEIRVNNNLDKNFNSLNSGESDIIAVNLAVTKERAKQISFTEPLMQTRQVLVQRMPDSWRRMSKRQLEKSIIRNQLDLANKVVYVQANSSYARRLKNLSDEIGDTIHVVEIPEYEVEELVKMVAKGEIDYTVCDENVALVNKTYYPNIDVSTAVSFPQNIAWGLRQSSPGLKEAFDQWFLQFKYSAEYAGIYNKYFKNQKSARIVKSDFYAISSGKISEYDDYIKKYSEEIDWDWRLLASLIYQESRFEENARSWAGAFGLMQLMPKTANYFGVNQSASVEDQIRAGVDFIKWLDERLADKTLNEEERVKFVLASYNVGLGHVLDARNLAKKNGKNPYVWQSNVDSFLLMKSTPKYYLDAVVQHGYCRGEEPFNYVNEILERYHHYQNVLQN